MNLLSIDQRLKPIPYHGTGIIREDGDTNYGFKNLKGDLSLIESIPELAHDAPLKSLVRSINDPQTGIFSTGCVMGMVDDDRGYRYSGYIEFALNSKAAVQDAQNYFPDFFHFDGGLWDQNCQLEVKFDWVLQPAHFLDANLYGFTCAIIVNTAYAQSKEEAAECWKQSLGLLGMYLSSITTPDENLIYPPPG
jgi:hypothetical protein